MEAVDPIENKLLTVRIFFQCKMHIFSQCISVRFALLQCMILA